MKGDLIKNGKGIEHWESEKIYVCTGGAPRTPFQNKIGYK